jgi:hypothetical protein
MATRRKIHNADPIMLAGEIDNLIAVIAAVEWRSQEPVQ